ncbi:MAG: cytochrome c [Candidatus Cybelea sp.]
MTRLVVLAVTLLALVTPRAPSYTDTQATQGQILFYENCAECHGASLEGKFGPALAGDGSNVQWETVSYVWEYMTAHMPAGNAAGLSSDEYVKIMAFLLKMHGNPPAGPLTPQAADTSKAPMGP